MTGDSSEIDYLRQRAVTERAAAEAADCPSARLVHLKMAERYEARLSALINHSAPPESWVSRAPISREPDAP